MDGDVDEGSIHCELDVASKSSSEGLRFDLSEKGLTETRA